MNILLKNRETLTQLFTSFNLQEALLVNQNLSRSWGLLKTPPQQILSAMDEKQVNIEYFLGKKCLPLIRFYLADQKLQKKTLLSIECLATLFTQLPAVEAVIFKEQIQRAQRSVLQTNQALSTLLSEESLVQKRDHVVQINDYQENKQQQNNQKLSQLAEAEKRYLDCFYYLEAGELHIVAEGKTVDVDMLLYSELSPLQQLQAQKLQVQKPCQFHRKSQQCLLEKQLA